MESASHAATSACPETAITAAVLVAVADDGNDSHPCPRRSGPCRSAGRGLDVFDHTTGTGRRHAAVGQSAGCLTRRFPAGTRGRSACCWRRQMKSITHLLCVIGAILAIVNLSLIHISEPTRLLSISYA